MDYTTMHEEDLLEIWLDVMMAVTWRERRRLQLDEKAATEVLASLKYSDPLEGLRVGKELADRMGSSQWRMIRDALEQGFDWSQIVVALGLPLDSPGT